MDPTPFPLDPPTGPPAGSYESFAPASNPHPGRPNEPPASAPGVAPSLPPKPARFLNIGGTAKDGVTPFPLAPATAPLVASGYGDRARSHGDLVSMDIAREHDVVPPSEAKIGRRVSMKGNEGRGMFGFARKDKEKDKDKDREREKLAERKNRPRRGSEQPDYARPTGNFEPISSRNSQTGQSHCDEIDIHSPPKLTLSLYVCALLVFQNYTRAQSRTASNILLSALLHPTSYQVNTKRSHTQTLSQTIHLRLNNTGTRIFHLTHLKLILMDTVAKGHQEIWSMSEMIRII